MSIQGVTEARWVAVTIQACPSCEKMDMLIVLRVGRRRVVECPCCWATFSVPVSPSDTEWGEGDEP